VLLQVVANTGDIRGDFVAIGETNTSDLTQCGVRLLRSRGTDCGADASLLRCGLVSLTVFQGVEALLHGGGGGLIGDLLSALADQLIKRRHSFPPFSNGGIYFNRISLNLFN
jgi:hypothetical protein